MTDKSIEFSKKPVIRSDEEEIRLLMETFGMNERAARAHVNAKHGNYVGDVRTKQSEPSTRRWSQEIHDVLAAIDSLHGGRLGRVPILVEETEDDTVGYSYDKETHQPIKIVIDPEARYPIYTCLHEIGHWIDHQALAPPQCFSSESRQLKGWLNAVQNSASVRELQTHLGSNSFYDPVSGEWIPISHKTIRYNLADAELFAHSYAHFVALHGTNEAAYAELQRLHNDIDAKVHFPLWEKEDFAPIAEQLLIEFERFGWLTMQETAEIQLRQEKISSANLPEKEKVEFTDKPVTRSPEDLFRILTEDLGWSEHEARARIESLRGNVVSDRLAISKSKKPPR
jgi:hypothetical protein